MMQVFGAHKPLAMGHRMKTSLLIVVVAMVAGCNVSGQSEKLPLPPQVDVAQVLVEPVTITGSFTGRLEAPETIQLRPRVSGYIQEVSFEEGELVEVGDVLFLIDPRAYESSVKASRAELEEARTQVQLAVQEAGRAGRLVESHAVSRQEYDQRQAALARARARVGMAEAALDIAVLNLEHTRVTAPVSGRAGRALVTKGNLANADESLLTTIVSVDPLHVYFDSNESVGMSSFPLAGSAPDIGVVVSLDGSDQSQRSGRLDFVSNRLNVGTGTLTFRAALPNPGGTLRPGQFARVEMPVARLERAVLVDRKAVLTDQDRRFVYVVGEDRIVERRPVRPGREVGGLLVIEEGLNESDRVVVDGTLKIFGAGMPVEPNTVAMRETPSGSNAAQTIAMHR